MKRTLSVMFLMSLLAACGGPSNLASGEGRNLRGTAPEGATVFAIDASGRKFDATMSGTAFEVALDPGQPAHLFVADAADVYVLRFDANDAGDRQSAIPDFQGTIDLGAVTVVGATSRSADPEAFAESENNPMEACDSDDDGDSDYDDADDDGDDLDDDEDDDDGNGGDDDDDDLDDDNDGDPDACDDDDDDDGISDDEDDDDGDHDDDGVDDEDDDDDDNDGADDDEDDDDDDDGVDDDEEEDDDDEEDDDSDDL